MSVDISSSSSIVQLNGVDLLNNIKRRSNELKQKNIKLDKRYRKCLNNILLHYYLTHHHHHDHCSLPCGVDATTLSYIDNESYENYSSSTAYINHISTIMSEQHVEPQAEIEADDHVEHNNSYSDVNQSDLPLGWIKCCDDDGVYFWHKPTGTVTRSPPSDSCLKRSKNTIEEKKQSETDETHEQTEEDDVDEDQNEKSKMLASHSSSSSDNQLSSSSNKRRFYVKSLGWVRINESELTLENSSKAVNKCIHDLSHGFNDYNDVVARWGEGKDLYMDVDHTDLLLVDPIEHKILNRQPINQIRVWGVGRDNARNVIKTLEEPKPSYINSGLFLISRERDFAYVSKDKPTKIYMCHVFRCEDVMAKEIASILRDICKKTSVSSESNSKSPLESTTTTTSFTRPQSTPTTLPIQPIDEPKKTINCKYFGSMPVTRSHGMDVLNDAIWKIYNKLIMKNIDDEDSDDNVDDDEDRQRDDEEEDDDDDEDFVKTKIKQNLKNIQVTVSPSKITAEILLSNNETSELLFECRVRYLTFLGISANNVKLCGIVVNCADDTYMLHAFYCEPSAGPLCKIIEAACKLRYQKCLDAQPEVTVKQPSDTTNQNSSQRSTLGTQLRSMFDLIRIKRKT